MATGPSFADVERLGPWFHNLRLGPDQAVETCPNHSLGDFPANFWRFFEHVLPSDLSGKSVLDIGCNAGFYSFEMKRRGAARVLGLDHEPLYLEQARFASEHLGLDVEFRQLDVYDVGQLRERFDLVLFLGVFYHLRHPLYALEQVVTVMGDQLLFQTMERGSSEDLQPAEDYDFQETGVFFDERFPRMYFMEHRFAGDASNWWIPNAAASAAMLRSVGLTILQHPCREVYLCRRLS
jgi:tRNA (mo5U34)-methyltransferase